MLYCSEKFEMLSKVAQCLDTLYQWIQEYGKHEHKEESITRIIDLHKAKLADLSEYGNPLIRYVTWEEWLKYEDACWDSGQSYYIHRLRNNHWDLNYFKDRWFVHYKGISMLIDMPEDSHIREVQNAVLEKLELL